mmetsp:Transcript_34578/g.45706  ORF Transcript_34578/g.45706 Transcript_34578/m.45706 type:complete len:357 (+) Transcript_34578:86-1156(+)
MIQKGLKNWVITGAVCLCVEFMVLAIRILKIESRLKRVCSQQELQGPDRQNRVPRLFLSEKGALVCQLSWLIAGIIVYSINLSTPCDLFNGFNIRITYLLYTLGQCTNYIFMYIRFKSLSSRVNSQVHPMWSQIFFYGIMCIPVVAFASFFLFISASEDDSGKCLPILPGWLAILFIISDTLLSGIGFYLFLKPLYLMRRAHYYGNQLQEAEKKMIMSNFLSVAISVSSTFVFMVLITYYSKKDPHFLVDYVWPLGPIDSALNSFSVGIAFDDYGFLCSKLSALALKERNDVTRTITSARHAPVSPPRNYAIRRFILVQSLKNSAFDSMNSIKSSIKAKPTNKLSLKRNPKISPQG